MGPRLSPSRPAQGCSRPEAASVTPLSLPPLGVRASLHPENVVELEMRAGASVPVDGRAVLSELLQRWPGCLLR